MSNCYPDLPILVVDDETESLQTQELLLYSIGFNNVSVLQDSRDVMVSIQERPPSCIILDLFMPYKGGKELLKEINRDYPNIPVIIVCKTDEADLAAECKKMGAYDCLAKPLSPGVTAAVLKKALKTSAAIYTRQGRYDDSFAHIITGSEKMHTIFTYMEKVAVSSEPVLITGECGVGKELIARSLHTQSRRKGKFVPVNVAGLDDTLFADALFGHDKGAFTGADRNKEGFIEEARGGTLFLDEIGDLSLSSQVKLLRLIQEKEYTPVGSTTLKRAQVHIITATNKNLVRAVELKQFRSDLFFRLNIHNIHIPPLRERMDDIAPLAGHFLEQASAKFNKAYLALPNEIKQLLISYTFPGNVRELRSIIYDAVVRSPPEKIDISIIKSRLENCVAPVDSHFSDREAASSCSGGNLRVKGGPFHNFPGDLPSLKEVGDLLVKEALERCGGKKTAAARMLGISHQALSKRLKKEQEI